MNSRRASGAPVPEDWPIAMRLARLTQRKDFLAAAEHGRRFRSSAFTAQVLDKPEQEGLRLGLTASRKTGNAVVRNRIRRRLRAAAALALAEQTGKPCDLVIVARPETVSAAFTAMVADIAVALDRARPSRGKRRPDRRSASRQAS
ncbi:MAG: ribonuclease P protein component [Stutzerimonas stutzeri]|nr:MAG: ribonuclease P protein component [Stutzerimonas stutzeri]